MNKVIRVSNLDCTNCAAKVERALNKIGGVNSASVNFFAQKIVLDIDDSRVNDVLDDVRRVCKRVEPDMRIIG